MAQAQFQLSIPGFKCLMQTWDNAAQTDGKADEVFIRVNTKTLDAQGNLFVPETETDTPTMGDTNTFPNRIQAGSASALGGIVSGDSFPDATPWIRKAGFNPDFPPYVIFEDVLDQQSGLVTFVIVGLWEEDLGGDMFGDWVQWLEDVDAEFGAKAKEIYGGRFPLIGWVFDAVSLGIKTLSTLPGIWSNIGKNVTRLIGLQKDPDNNEKALANPPVFVLTYDQALRMAEHNSPQGKGVFSIPYRDDPKLAGSYLMYFQMTVTWVPHGVSDGTFITSPGHPENYVVYGGARFLIRDAQTFDRLTGGQGHAIQQVIDDRELMALSTLPMDGTYLIEESSQIGYRMHGTLRRQVDDPGNVIAWWCKVPDGALKDIPIESIVQAQNTPEVYVIIKAVRYLITGQDQLDHFTGGGGQSSVHVISAADLARITTVPAEGTYLQEMGDGHIYRMHAGMRDLVAQGILVGIDQITTVPTGALAGIVIRSLPVINLPRH